MRYSPAVLGGMAWILLLAESNGARAELIQWSYSWSRSPVQVHADSPGTGYISLSNGSGLKSAAGNSFLTATNLDAHSTATDSNPDVFTNKTYTLSLFLQDHDSGNTGTVTFTGEFNGTLSANNSNVTNTFIGPTTQTLLLGEHLYTVTIGPFVAPGPTGADASGSIGARAEVRVSTIFHTPEPSSCLLALVGMAGVAFARPRRRSAF
jgi:hypothetical protein